MHCALPVDLSAHHHAVPVLHRQTELCTPLWDLQGGFRNTLSLLDNIFIYLFFYLT